MKIAVLGSGSWGSALSIMAARMGHQVSLWSAFQQEADELNRSRTCHYLKEVSYPETLEITADISVVAEAQLVILVTPSFAVRETAKKMNAVLRDGTVVVSAAKGIENETFLRMSQIIREQTGQRCPVVALSGPSHAEEVSAGVPTGCVAASTDQEAAQMVQQTLMNPAFRVYTSEDIVGVELGGALKNIVALCCGICDGLGYGDNTKAMLMTRGLTEMARLGVAMGGRRETFAGLTGLGDLIVTCTSMHSRNRRAGILIGQGKGVQQAMEEVGAVVEGYYVTASAWTLARRLGVEMPITDQCHKVLYENRDIHKVLQDLMNRPGKQETDEQLWI